MRTVVLEPFDNSVDLFEEGRQDVLYLGESATRWRRGMCYGYLNRALVLVVHLLLRRGNNEVGDLCATFYRPHMLAGSDGGLIVSARFPCDSSLGKTGDDNIEKPVLVRIVEVSDKAQEGRELLVRSTVRLRSLDACIHASAKRGDPGSLLDKQFEGIRDRESVEGGAEIMHAVAGDKRPTIEGRTISDFDETMAAAFSVTLLGDDTRITVLPQSNFSLQGIEVFFSPAEFEPANGKLRPGHSVPLS